MNIIFSVILLFFVSSFSFANTKTEAESFTEKSASPYSDGVAMNSLSTGDWLKYSGITFNNETTFAANVASNSGGGTIEVRLGSITGTLIGTLIISDTKDWATYTLQSTNLTATTGTFDVFLVFKNNLNGVCNIDWFAIGDIPPVITANTELKVFLPYNEVTLSATVQNLSSVKNTSWEIIEGVATLQDLGVTANVSDLAEGSYTVRFTATNSSDLSAFVDFHITAKYITESPVRSTDPPRVKIIETATGKTIASADGQRLRGVPMGYSTSDLNNPYDTKIFNTNFYKEARNMGFNAVRCFVENPDLNNEAALNKSLDILDTIVNLTSKYGLQLMLNAGNIGYFRDPDPAELKRLIEYNKRINVILTYRYKNRTHVIFEQQNEPIYDNPNPYPTVVQDIADCYTLMRLIAPDSHITLFTFMISCGYSMLDMAKALDSKASIDWTKTTVGYHGYGPPCANISRILELKAQFPVVQTEFWPEKGLGEGGFGTSYEMEGLEANEISWFTWWLHTGDISIKIYEPIFADLKAAGKMWDFTPIDLQEPVVDLGKDTAIFLPQNSVTLKGKVSDPNGSIVKYNWVLVKSTGTADFTQNNETADLTNMTKGVYFLRLFAWDNEDNYTYDDIQVVVTNKQSIPGQIEAEDYTASFGVDGTTYVGWIQSGDWTEYKVDIAEEGLYSIEVSTAVDAGYGGSGFFLLDGAPVSSVFVAAPTGGWGTYLPVNCTAFLPAGNHTLRYEPINAGGYNLDWFNFTKVDATIEASSDQIVTFPNPVDLTVTATSPAGIASYEWKVIQGKTGYILSGDKTNILTLSSLSIGEYFINVTVTTNDSKLITETVKVTVIPCEDNPSVNTGADKKFSLPTNSVSITAIATSNSGIASYTWEKISGPAATISNDNTATLNLSDLTVGFYNFEITVVSTNGCIATDEVMVKVFAAVVGIDDLHREEMTVKMFPNPAKHKVYLERTESIKNTIVQMTDVNGKVLKQCNWGSDKLEWTIDQYAKGLYIISISDRDKIIRHKLLIE